MVLVEQKKGGPYSEKERRIRRERVADLFFDRGFSAITISRMLNVNRNTINRDLDYCYTQLKKENDDFDSFTICMTQFHRMHIQRTRFVDLLHKELELKDRFTLEKMLSDIDNKIMQAALKIQANSENIEKFGINHFNSLAKEQHLAIRATFPLRAVSVEAFEKLEKIVEEDNKKHYDFSLLKQGNSVT